MTHFRPIAALFLACFVAAVPAATFANSNKAKDLVKVEKVGLNATSKKRLRSFITPKLIKQTPISLSRRWIDQQPKASGDAQWRCLAEALYFEARGESVKGQFAVAEVIQNRVRSGRFPSSLCAVINQGTGRKHGCQFSYTCDGYKEVIAEPRAFARVSKVARASMDGKAPPLTEGATHYHTTAVRPRWGRVYTRTAKIGVHLFYRHTWRSASN